MSSAAPKASLGRTIKIVAWSFLGIRKNSEFKEDLARVTPLQVVAVGIVGALIFVLGLVSLVQWVVAK